MNWLRDLLKRFARVAAPEHYNRHAKTVDMLSAAERDAIVAKHLNKHLPALGLSEITPRVWIDDSKPPAKPMFEFSLLKGAGMKACWGFSLDFVPHISGRNIRWHRNNQTAKLDVIVDPRGLEDFSFLYGSVGLESDLERHLPAAIERARETWRRGDTWHGMLEIVQEIREKKINRLGFYNYVQLPFAFAFLSAKVGNLGAAEAELMTYAQTHELGDEITMKLMKHLRNLDVVSDRAS